MEPAYSNSPKEQENNFWDLNPELLILPEFNELYEKDSSKNKEKSSKLMWALYYVYNPSSKLFNLPLEQKQTAVKKTHLPTNFNWDKLEQQISVYKNLTLSDAERALINWNDTMVMRDNAVKKLYQDALLSGDVDTLVKIDKMLASTPKMFEDYKKIKKDFEEEKTLKKGSKIKSLSDNNEM
jgi:hypothetical protein